MRRSPATASAAPSARSNTCHSVSRAQRASTMDASASRGRSRPSRGMRRRARRAGPSWRPGTVTHSDRTIVAARRDRPRASSVAATPAISSAASHGSAIATSGRLTVRSSIGHSTRIRALDNRSSRTCSSRRPTPRTASVHSGVRRANSLTTSARQQSAGGRADRRMRADLVHAEVDVPSDRHEDGVDVRRQGAEAGGHHERRGRCGARERGRPGCVRGPRGRADPSRGQASPS